MTRKDNFIPLPIKYLCTESLLSRPKLQIVCKLKYVLYTYIHTVSMYTYVHKYVNYLQTYSAVDLQACHIYCLYCMVQYSMYGTYYSLMLQFAMV